MVVVSWGQLCPHPPGSVNNAWAVLFVTLRGRECVCYWHLGVEAGDAAKHSSVVHRTAPTTKNHPDENVSSADIENTFNEKLEISFNSKLDCLTSTGILQA